MNDVGLYGIRSSFVGDHNGSEAGGGGGDGVKCISGGQRRRLSIALEVLANPATILLDEVSFLSFIIG
jgi:ABC-type transport system involved in cytochrome bd biosynthesis fused ATPase/permease subunit